MIEQIGVSLRERGLATDGEVIYADAMISSMVTFS
jgi:hypothetical protein